MHAPATTSTSPKIGFSTLHGEVVIDELALQGELPVVALRVAAAHRPGQVRGR